MTSIFISYSRKDVDFAGKIVQTLAENDLDTWVDWKSIPKGEDWEQEIYRGIEEAETFIFLISPDSIKSEICNKEVAHAVKNNKRIVPLVVRDADIKNFFDEIPRKEISRRNWIYSRDGQDNLSKAIEETLTTIHTDYEWLKYHTGLQVKALEWERTNRERSFLLHGKELQDAELQLATNTSKDPHPTDLQREYVLGSRQSSDRQRRLFTIVAIVVAVAMTGLAIFGFDRARLATANANEAQTQAAIAQTNEKEAQEQAAIARARELAAVSIANLDLDPDLSMHLAIESLDKMRTSQGEDALRRALLSPPVEFTLLGHSGAVYSVEYDREGKRLVTTSEDGTARIWDAATGEELMALHGHQGAVRDASFSPTGQFIATAGADGTVRIWDAKTWHELYSMNHNAAVNSVGFSPNGQYIVTASDDETARVWQVSTGDEIHNLEGHSAAVLCAVFSPNGELIATGGNDQTINFWEAKTGELTNSISNGSENVHTIAFSSDSQYILFDWLYNVYRWDLRNESPATKYFGGHSWYITSVAFSPLNGRQVVTASSDHTVRIWDTKSANQIAILRGQGEAIYGVAFDPTEDHLATASEDQTVRIWNLGEWRKRVLIEPGGYMVEAIYSYDGQHIATSGSDGMIRIWDAATGQELNSWAYRAYYPGYVANRIHFSPDDKQIITASDDGTWGIWDAKTGEPVYQTQPDGVIISDANFNRDGTRIITTDRNHLSTIWDAKTKEPLSKFTKHGTGIWTGIFSPDGRMAVTASADRTARVWDTQTGEQIHILLGHTALVTSAAFNSDGKRIVTTSVDATARIWDTATGQLLLILKGHTREVSDAVFSPTDPYVATSGRDNKVIVWNYETGDQIAELFGHSNVIFRVAFSPDGKHLLTSSFDGTARIYPVRFEDALALAHTLLSPRELTCDERIKYLHEEIVCPTPTPISIPSP